MPDAPTHPGPLLEDLPVRTSVEVVLLLASPEHHYFGRPRDGAPHPPSAALPRVDVVVGKGVVGDRFFGRAAHIDAAVTLMAVEALEGVARDLGLPGAEQPGGGLDPRLPRRNVVLRGAPVDALVGADLALDCREAGGGVVRLAGRRPAAPCAWMDEVLAPGAHAALRGRGGLRCVPTSSGALVVGPAELRTAAPVDVAAAGTPVLRRGRLP
ncbi:molybdenum cofactor biosysynthesis protein [uncultured Pseudokineococcus sp.]|uniref:molybdenum cofactor biosysynthesis protein n=1 Tax=uncultured Pseudokineococcus sp. TaxID=1642928 RepID=UPI00260A7E7B|nr:molybdenum cofactor biosysynthesis protein [uncultured Pseudokineococcus sp.]